MIPTTFPAVTTTSDLCQLRNHVKALELLIVENYPSAPITIAMQFTQIEKLFAQLLICEKTTTIIGDYPVHEEFLEKSSADKLHQIAVQFIPSVIERGKMMMFGVTETGQNVSPFMRLINKMLQAIGFEILHYVKNKQKYY